MRLIDADKIEPREIYRGFYDPMTQDFVQFVYMDDIDKAPTVEAIPIEWLKDYVGSGVSDDIFQRNRRFVLNMIKDWEKENE